MNTKQQKNKMTNIWAKNLTKNEERAKSSEGRIIRILEKVRWLDVVTSKKFEVIFCGYYFQGEELPEDERLVYSKTLDFKVVKAEEIKAFKNISAEENEDTIKLIQSKVSTPKTRKRGKFSREDTTGV